MKLLDIRHIHLRGAPRRIFTPPGLRLMSNRRMRVARWMSHCGHGSLAAQCKPHQCHLHRSKFNAPILRTISRRSTSHIATSERRKMPQHYKRQKISSDESALNPTPNIEAPEQSAQLIQQRAPPVEGDISLARRAGMAEAARRRAAHFANYAAADDESTGEGAAGNIHVGGSEARHLGMWSSAMELVNAREQARQKREQQIMGGGTDAPVDRQCLAWTPSRDPIKGKRVATQIPSLFSMALHLVVEYIEDVETLWGIPDVIKSRIAAAVCCSRRLSPSVIKLYTEDRPAELSLPDCTQIDATTMAEALLACASTRLTKMSLGLCGRSMTDEIATKFAAACGGYPAARALHLSGAYRLSDQGLLALLRNMPHLTELSLPQCSRLEGASVESLPGLVPNLRSLDLDECRGLAATSIQAALVGLPKLESVVLNGIPEVRDDLMPGLADCVQLQRISVCNCAELTDAGIATLALALPGLKEIRLDDCTRVTSKGILSLAASCPSLQQVSLRGLSKVEPEALAILVERGTIQRLCLHGMHQVDAQVVAALALYCKDSLEELDVSWCRKLSNEDLGYLADNCKSLRLIDAWGCSQLTDTFFMGHSNDGLDIVGRGETLRPVPSI